MSSQYNPLLALALGAAMCGGLCGCESTGDMVEEPQLHLHESGQFDRGAMPQTPQEGNPFSLPGSGSQPSDDGGNDLPYYLV